jgi:alcohol dehydrogenase class IV
MTPFEFASATRIVFGRGAAFTAIKDIRKLGSRALLVTGRDVRRAAPFADALISTGMSVEFFPQGAEPTVDDIQNAREAATERRCDLVISFGGGSAIDAGKAVAALMTNDGEVMDYLEVKGKGLPVAKPPAPFVAVPTTAGTGAEVTKNAVIFVPSFKVKFSMRSPMMLPRLAIIDPLLTLSMSKRITAAVGLDALTQVIEPFISNAPNPITDALCKEGMMRAARSLRIAYQDGEHLDAREDMCVVSLFGGLCLANAKLGAVHGFAGPIGGMFDAPHGKICGILLPHVMASLASAAAVRSDSGSIMERLDEVARLLTGNPKARASDGVEWIKTLTCDLGLPSLSSFGITAHDIDEIVNKAALSSSMKGSPVAFTETDLRTILLRALSVA